MPGLLSRDVLVISQKARLVRLGDEYPVRDEHGAEIAVVREESPPLVARGARRRSGPDGDVARRRAVYDRDGTKVVELVQPRQTWTPGIEIADGEGRPVGTVTRRDALGKRRFTVESATGEPLGAVDAESWTAWDYRFHDRTGAEVGRITKRWSGFLTESFTSADNYALEITGQAPDDLRLIMLAIAAGVDVALRD